MAHISLICVILATYFCFARGQEACATPDGGSGVCKSIFECPQLLKILSKTDKTQEEVDLLKVSRCGFLGPTPKVCCTNSCLNPEGKPGSCVSIFSCPHLANMLTSPVSKQNVEYVKNSKCESSEKYSVCCTTEEKTSVAPPGTCAATVTAFPPDPSTECCGVDSRVGNKIVGGNATTVDEYPWLILVEYLKLGKIRTACGGALISGQYVLTAAHCVVGRILDAVGKPVNIRLGEYDTKNSGKDCAPVEAGAMDCTEGIVQIPIEQLIPHPEYNPRARQSPNDIGLIKMAKIAPFTDFIRPICLPKEDVTASPPVNLTLFTAGWGETATHASSNLKLHVDLPYTDQDQCEPSYEANGQNVHITSKQICAGGAPGKDSCRGDSGGPLMYEKGKAYEIIGVVSFGPTPCGLPNVPGVYTKVFEYLPWIRQNIVG